MSAKYFCDQCGKEMPEKEHVRLCGVDGGPLDFEIITGLHERHSATTWNRGHFCHSCIRAAVAATAAIKETPQ